MAEYVYEAIDLSGKEQKGNIIAENMDLALLKLKEENLYATQIKESNLLTRELDITIGDAVSPRDLSVFCRQFVSMLSSGVTILAALDMLSQQTENKRMAKALKKVQKDIEKGESLASAMRRQNKIFPDIMVNMVAAGEASGKLEVAFTRMADHFEKTAKTKSMIRKASVYPLVIAVVAVVVVIVMLVKVIPSYMEMFDSMDIELPWITLAVVGASKFLIKYWYLIAAVVAVVVSSIITFRRTNDGKELFGKMAIKAPLFGKLNIKTASSLMARTLSTLIYSGLPLVEALKIVGNTMTNQLYKNALLQAAEDVKRGVPLSQPLKRCGLFPPMVSHMISIGEETGELEEMLERLAAYYDEEVESTTETVMAALEPMIILIMAALVGILIAAVMSPMAALYGNMGNI